MSEIVNVETMGHVALVELNRPSTMNAFDGQLRHMLAETLADLARDQTVNVLVLTGAGKAFSSGSDLKSAATTERTPRSTALTLLHDFGPIVETISRMDKLVIAAVNGPAAGVGMSLALACDLMIIAKGAYLLSPFTAIGLVPDGGLLWFLIRRLGCMRALEVVLEGQRLSAERCVELGVANRMCEAENLRSEALAWAQAFAAKAPLAAAHTKRLARFAVTGALSDSMILEAELQNVCAGTEDAREAINAFLEKRSPSFKGR